MAPYRSLTHADLELETENPFLSAQSDEEYEMTYSTETSQGQFEIRHSSIETSKESIEDQLLPNNFKNSISSHSSLPPYLNNGLLDSDPDFSPFGGFPQSLFPLHIDEKENDDYLHNPDPVLDLEYENNRFAHDFKQMDKKSLGGMIGFFLLFSGSLVLFVLLPVLSFSGVAERRSGPANLASFEVLTEYQYPTLRAIRTSTIDPDTPDNAMTREARDGSSWDLVFSDEFNAEGRTFYEGDDQFWYAADIHYAATNDLEWYDPDAARTANGSLQIRMDAIQQHGLFYRSAMLHSWNKMCFTQGILEVSVRLPNRGDISGLWPGVWTLGNIARPGYLATTEGTWPYSYEACDAGITPNQSSPDGISFLPGQKLNSCTCPGEDHPNPGVGRGAPEIDAIEIELNTEVRVGVASQSVQIAPMDIWYIPDYDFIEVHNSSVTSMNTYTGGPFQQALSARTTLNTTWYDRTGGLYQKYAFEYLNDNDNGYIRWFVGDEPTFTVHSYSLAPNGNIDWRRISKEPMSIIMNLGISNNWAYIDWTQIEFPSVMSIDYVRVYQPSGNVSLTCDPENYPTVDYIENHLSAYRNPNHTSWEMAGYQFPSHELFGCSS